VNCIQDELGAMPYFGTCDVCERDWLVSQYRCIDCDLDICRFCIHEHRLFKHDARQKSKILRIEAPGSSLGMNLTSEKTCSDHKDELLQMYCNTCSKPVCVTCACSDHKRHDTMPLVKKLASTKTLLQCELDRLNVDVHTAGSALADLVHVSDSATKNCEESVKLIRQQARHLTLVVDEMAAVRIDRLQNHKTRCVQEIEAYSKVGDGWLFNLVWV
jgi:hypothetical protein